jgi:membrane protease YdiL (CAAX protease family)
MKNNEVVNWRNVILYCALAYLLFWVPFIGATLTSKNGNDPGAWGITLGILGPFSPLLAALFVRIFTREGFGDAHLGIRSVRWYYWLVAILLPFFWNGVQDVLLLVSGFAKIEWSQITRGVYRIPINLFGGLIIFIGEEFGWRSYLVEKLRPLGRWTALLWSGVIWSLWHLLAVSIPNTATSYGQDMSIFGIALTLLIFVLMGFIFGWLYLESGSVWPCVLMHSYNNLISFKLLSEAWTSQAEPTLLQNALIAIGPMLFVWIILYSMHKFGNRMNAQATDNINIAR